MKRRWTAPPIVVMAAVPIWTAPSASVITVAAIAAAVAAIGVIRRATGGVVAGCILAAIGYALAVWSERPGLDVIGATIFGLAVLALLEWSEFARRFRSVDVAGEALRRQRAYWLGQAAVVVGTVAALTLAGFVVSLLIPAVARAVVTGAGAVLAFAGALGAGIVRRPGEFEPDGPAPAGAADQEAASRSLRSSGAAPASPPKMSR
ncbi:MAG TPA: hypothetical protein VMF86_11445 [Stellaceae bacterium]|nr:hypothetical protein [Stellaceae bacterium]